MVKVRPLESLEYMTYQKRPLSSYEAREAWTERLKVKQIPSGQWVLEDTVTNAWYCFGDKRPSPDDVKEGIRCLTHYQMTDEDREALRSQQMLPGLLGPPEEEPKPAVQVGATQAMYLAAMRANETWLTSIGYGKSNGYGKSKPEPKPKIVYTASAPGRCKECGLKTVLTRNEKDICQACDAIN